jgi:hypothetical protein
VPAKASRRLVIDASVGGAAGGKLATFPTSKNCRDFLLTVRKLRHRIIMTPHLNDEWDRHQSSFAQAWLSSMVSRRRVIFVQIAPSNKLRRQIESTAANMDARRTMRKDFHLIEAAMAFDKTVVSLDEEVRSLFGSAARSVIPLSKIVWVNPDNADEGPIKWLENRAKPERKRMLGYKI